MHEKREGWDVEERWKARSAFACLALLASLACLALLVGCGYQFRVEGAGPTIGGAAGDLISHVTATAVGSPDVGK